MAELRKRPHGLQIYWVWSPVGFQRNVADGDWTVWWRWHFYFHRTKMARPLHIIYKWVAQVGPLGIRMWR